jgi:RND family efflux transporter MFP subunit
VVDPFILKLEGAVTEKEVALLREGSRAVVSFDGVAERFEGYVHWVSFEANPSTGKFDVEIRVENPDLKLRPGVVGRAQVLKNTHGGVIAIPRDAVVQRGGDPIAFVVEEEVARERRLRLGPDQGLLVVVEEGIETGDRLIVRGQREIHDGSAVRIQEEATDPDGTLPDDPDVISQTGTNTGRGATEVLGSGDDR